MISKAQIPPHYLELVADAALKSYWRKKALGKATKANATYFIGFSRSWRRVATRGFAS